MVHREEVQKVEAIELFNYSISAEVDALIETAHSHLCQGDVEIDASEDVLAFQVDLVSKTFHIQLGVCGRSGMEKTLASQKTGRSVSTGQGRAEHGSEDSLDLSVYARGLTDGDGDDVR